MKLSELNLPKIKTYVGFSIKSGKVVYGTDNILLTQKPSLIMVDKSLSENAYSKVVAHAESIGAKLIEVDDLKEITHKDGVKVIGITTKQLSKAIISSINNNQ